MRFKMILPAVCTIPLLLAGCGGGDGYTNPYDGTWTAVYPVADKSSVSATQTVTCSTIPPAIVIKNGTGTTIQSTKCDTDIFPTATTPEVKVSGTTLYYISVSIVGKALATEKDVINAIVNGATYTGQCISTVACSAVDSAGGTLSLTR